MSKKKSINLPTVLTFLRIVLVIPLMVGLLSDGDWAKIIALICFIVAALTDFLDGRIARKYKIETDLGRFLDPLADKMLVNLTVLSLVTLDIVPVWIFAIVLVRDFAVDGMRMMVARNGETVAASIWGKAKTMTQMVSLVIILFSLILNNATFCCIGLILFYISVALSVFSGLDYLIKGWKKVIK